MRVEAPHFVAGLVVSGDSCVEAAPISQVDRGGKTREELKRYFRGRKWIAKIVPE